MATERSVYLRIATKDVDKTLADLNRLGIRGERALKQVGAGGPAASKALLAVDAASKSARAGIGGLANAAAAAGGPLGGVASQASMLGGALRGGGGAAMAAAAGVAALTAGVGASIGRFTEYERQMARVEAQIRAAGGASGVTANQIGRMAQRLGDATLTSADAARNALSSLLSFNKIGGGILEETAQRAQDVAEVFGRDLQGAAVQVGKALQDPARGMSELRETGIAFTQSQIDAARALQETGRHAEAQRIVLDQLARQVGGAGVGAAGGLAGTFDTAGEEALRLAENLGRIAVEALGLDGGLQGLTGTLRALNGELQDTARLDPGEFAGRRLADIRSDLAAARKELADLTAAQAAGPLDRFGPTNMLNAGADENVQKIREQIAALESLERAAQATAGAMDLFGGVGVQLGESGRVLADLRNQKAVTADILKDHAEQLRLARMAADQRTIEKAALDAIAEGRKKGVTEAHELAEIEASARSTAAEALKIQEAQAEAAKAEAEAVAEAVKAADDLSRRNVALEEYIAGLEDEVTLAGMGSDERERHVALLKAAETAQRQLSAEEAARVSIAVQQRQAMEAQEAAAERAAEAARRRQEQWRDAERQAAEQAQRDWQHTGDRIVDFFSDAFAQVRADGTESMQSLAEDAREALTRSLSQISMEIMVRPITQAIGSAGLSGLRDLAPLGLAAAGSASQSTIMSALGAGSALFNGSSTFGTALLDYGLGNAGSTLASLGLANPAVGGGIGGPVVAGYAASGLGNALAGGLNAAPYGAIGTLGAQLLGFESRNPYIGAGLGIVGSVGGGAAGAAIGSALGLAGGGPVGAVVGAALAQIASSYIGGAPSVGPNESAYLGLQGNRFQVGGSGQDNGGNAAQAASVVQSAADALNTLIGAAGLRVSDPSQSFWSYGVGTPGISPYSATSAEQLVAQVIGSGRLTSDDPNVQMALGRTSGTAEQMMTDLGFAADFEDALRGMQAATLDYAELLETSARRAVEDQVDALTDFRDTTERLGLDTSRADTAMRDYVRTMLGLRPEPETLSPVEEALTRMRVQWEALGPLLDQVGISAAEAEGGLAVLRERIRTDFVQSLQADINEARGVGIVNTISGLIEQAAQHRQDAAASGADVSLVDQWLQSMIAQQLNRADEAGVLAVLTQLASSPVAVTAATAALADLRVQVEELGEAAAVTIGDLAGADSLLRDEIAAGVREMADAARAAADAFGGFATTLGRYRQDLLVGDLSPLSAGAQLDTARARVEALRSGIAAGDEASYAELQNAVASFLGASRQFNASGPGYSADFNVAQDLLAQAEQQAAAEEARARAVQDAALRQVDELRGIRGVLDSLSAPLIEFARLGASVLTGQAGGASAISSQHALLQTMSPDELAVALGTMAVGGQGQAFARGVLGTQDFSGPIQAALRAEFDGIGADLTAGAITGAEAMQRQLALYARSDLDTLSHFAGLTNPKGVNAKALRDFMDQLAGENYARLQGYAAGGIVGTEGAYRLAEGGRPEAVVPLPDGRSIPVTMAGGGGADTRALQAEVRALRDQVAALTRVVTASGDRQVEGLQAVAGNTGEMARKLRIAGSRT
ncbi:MAG: phage tail length tape measure family protein [Sneathiellaceae bacterium]